MRSSRAAISRYSAASSRPERVDRLEELVGDARDRDVPDVDLLAADQVQEEVERAGVPVEGDDERRRPTAPGTAAPAAVTAPPTGARSGATSESAPPVSASTGQSSTFHRPGTMNVANSRRNPNRPSRR